MGIQYSNQAKGVFEIKSWDEKTWDGRAWNEASGAKLTHAIVTSVFRGDIEGEGTAHSLMSYPDDNSATFIGLQQVTGNLDGRTGSFVLQVNGTYTNGVASATWVVMADSATGDLRGLRGEGGYMAKHEDYPNVFITLDYDFA